MVTVNRRINGMAIAFQRSEPRQSPRASASTLRVPPVVGQGMPVNQRSIDGASCPWASHQPFQVRYPAMMTRPSAVKMRFMAMRSLDALVGLARINDEWDPEQRETNKEQDDHQNEPALVQAQRHFLALWHKENPNQVRQGFANDGSTLAGRIVSG